MSSADVFTAAVLAQAANPDRKIRSYRTEEYPKQVWYFVACFIFLVGVCNLVSRVIPYLRKRAIARTDVEGEQAPPSGAISYRRAPVAVVNAFRMVAFRSVIPLGFGFSVNLAELFVSAAYMTIISAWSLAYTTNSAGRRFDPGYYANRAGDIATAQLPLLVALAMKNNPISILTGISYEKLNFLHRMFSRAICVILWIHAGGRIHVKLKGKTAITEPVLQWGIVGLAALSLLCLFSVRPLRRLEYEWFLITHFLFVLVFLMGSVIHAKCDQKEYFVWPAIALWIADRVVRFIRIIVFNHSYFGLKSGVGTFNATTHLVAEGYVRLTFRRPSHLHWSAGQNAYLTMPGVSAHPFEAHPFTIANADISRDEREVNEKDDPEKRSISSTESVSTGKDVVFLINARQGFTKRLLDIASKDGSLRVFLDGPYGTPPSLRGYDSAVLIAGGSGITFTCPLFVDLVHRARRDPSSTCRRVTFIWIIRHLEQISLVHGDLSKALEDVPPSLSVDTRIFVTAPSPAMPSLRDSATASITSSAPIDSPVEKTESLGLPLARMETGRPDIRKVLDDAASLARGSMSVNGTSRMLLCAVAAEFDVPTVCGPTGLTEDVRKALRSPAGLVNIMKGGPSIDLFVEHFDFA
ncbi:hypothetical protein EWM64_g8760 [Hericium alpestre]|uniref:ferric-chelate reductase (NADPH) n=1 Tax=Hericium alpestre TaxID=135208 RepID=A0A4Y9ZKJ1_9AGAM|nr:hypothetical protein EWM64_g8760 [Hericium alpestre]